MQLDLAEAGEIPDSPPSIESWRSKTTAGVVIFLLYLVGGFVAFWHVWSHPATWQIQGGAGDPAQYDWFLRWVPWAMAHGANPFVTHAINVPFGVNLVENTSIVALGAIMAPVTVIWGPVASLNVLFTLSFPLSAAAGYLLARRFVKWRPAAFAAGLLYGYSPYMVGQGLGHINLVFVPLPPLIMLVLHQLLVRQRGSSLRWGALLGLLIVIQFLISAEVLATTALFSAVALVVLGLADRRSIVDRLRRAWPGIVVAVGMAAVLLAWPLYDLFAGPQRLPGKVGGYRVYHSTLAGTVFPTPLLQFATARMKGIGQRAGANNSENGAYIGVPLLVLAISGTVFLRRRAIRLTALLAAIAYVLSLGVRLHVGIARYDGIGRHVPLPAAVISKIPLLDQAYPARYSLFVALFLSLFLGLAVDAMHEGLEGKALHFDRRRTAGGWMSWLPLGVAVVVLLPLVPAWPYPDQGSTQVPAFFTSPAVDRLAPGTVTLVYPYPMNTEIAPELWQATSNLRFRMIGGYFLVPAGSGFQFYTPTLTQSVLTGMLAGQAPAETPALRAQLLGELRQWHVQAIVAQPVGADPIGFFTWLTGRSPDATAGGMAEWYHTTWQ